MPPGGGRGDLHAAPVRISWPTYRYIGSTAKRRDDWDSLGDLGWFDDEGYLYLADRRVDMFTVGGRNVPAEIEHARRTSLGAVLSGGRGTAQGTSARCRTHWSMPRRRPRISTRRRSKLCRPTAGGVQGAAQRGFVDTPLRDDAGKARRTAVRDEVIARRARS